MTEKRNEQCWNTPDFEVRFREAMGRDMTPQEREYFGLTTESAPEEQRSEDIDSTPPNPRADRSEFAWQALRRFSALLG